MRNKIKKLQAFKIIIYRSCDLQNLQNIEICPTETSTLNNQIQSVTKTGQFYPLNTES